MSVWPLEPKRYHAARRVGRLLRVPRRAVLEVLSGDPSSFYRSWKERKKSGGLRTIHAPEAPLDYIQRMLLAYLQDQVAVSPIAHGYVRKRGIATNALPHLTARSAFCVDLKDAFSSMSFGERFLYYPAYGQPWPQREPRT